MKRGWNLLQVLLRKRARLGSQERNFFCLLVCLLTCFLGPHPRQHHSFWQWCRIGPLAWGPILHHCQKYHNVATVVQLPAYTTVTATRDPSHVCKLHDSSQQRQILNPLCKARNQTLIFMDTSQICFHCATTGTPRRCFLGLFVGFFVFYLRFKGS